MSSSRPVALAVVFVLAAAQAGCGFRPLYGQANGRALEAALYQVEVQPIQGRLGVEMYNRLRDRLPPRGVGAEPPEYELSVEFETRSVGLITEKTSRIRRFDLVVTANYSLVDTAADAIVDSGEASSAASYNVLDNDSFATLAAEQDAERQAARTVSDQIALELAIFLERKRRDQVARDEP